MLWTEGDLFADWCEQHLVHSEDVFAGKPVVWERWQREFFDVALEVTDEETLEPHWQTIALVVARKNGKTAMLAALALYRLFNDDGRPEILLAAGTDKQAGRLFDACINYLRRNPELDEQVHRREYMGEIAHVDSGGKVIRLPASGDVLDGANPSLAICDELHAWTTPTRRRVWDSLNTAGAARLRRQVFTITTAGDASTRHSSILGKIIDGTEGRGDLQKPSPGLTVSRNHEGRTLLFNYSAPTLDPLDVQAMQMANPASWVTDSYLLSQANKEDLTAATVLQLHGCVWAAQETSFADPNVLQDALSDRLIDENEPVVLGFDGSERRDETWLVACTLDGHLEPLMRWARPKNSPDSWRIPRKEVLAAVETAFERFKVVEFAGDPPGWYAEFDVWADLHGDKVVEFETRQAAKMAPACERTQTALNNREITIGGPLSGKLLEHFGNCVTYETRGYGYAVTKDHPDSPRKIDGAVASIIAYDRACWHVQNGVQRPVAFTFA